MSVYSSSLIPAFNRELNALKKLYFSLLSIINYSLEGKISYICDPTLNVVFTCDSPALVMLYDSVIGLHSLWTVTQAKQEVRHYG